MLVTFTHTLYHLEPLFRMASGQATLVNGTITHKRKYVSLWERVMTEGVTRRVSIRERASIIGNIVGINAFRANRTLLKQRFAGGGYQLRETAHFLLFTREQAPTTIVAHWFAPDEIDADIGYYFLQELKPSGILNTVQDFGNLFGAIIFSVYPSNTQQALRLYATNTLRRYRLLLDGKGKSIAPRPMDDFALLYQRVRELLTGETLLDAGCSFGFLPLLMAEYVPTLKRIAGIDIQSEPFAIVRAIAAEKHYQQVEFAQADLLSETFGSSEHFDTVVALHVLEHFSEADMYRVLSNLLKVTSRRLLIAVPYEPGEPEAVYGHQQLFTPTSLQAVGQWCLERSKDIISVRLETCAGGLLIIDKQHR